MLAASLGVGHSQTYVIGGGVTSSSPALAFVKNLLQNFRMGHEDNDAPDLTDDQLAAVSGGTAGQECFAPPCTRGCTGSCQAAEVTS
jgi:hypothetical protein